MPGRFRLKRRPRDHRSVVPVRWPHGRHLSSTGKRSLARSKGKSGAFGVRTANWRALVETAARLESAPHMTKSEQGLRLMVIGQPRLEPVALSASGHEGAVNGWTAAS